MGSLRGRLEDSIGDWFRFRFRFRCRLGGRLIVSLWGSPGLELG